jgi:hypothetical protein
MRALNLTIGTNCIISGYEAFLFSIIWKKAPNSFSKITSLALCITDPTPRLEHILILLQPASLSSLSIDIGSHFTVQDLQKGLLPLRDQTSITSLTMTPPDGNEFWSDTIHHWTGITSASFQGGYIGFYTAGIALSALSSLPSLSHLQLEIDSDQISNTDLHCYLFSSMTKLSITFYAASQRQNFFLAINSPSLQDLKLLITQPCEEAYFVTLFIQIAKSFSRSLISLEIEIMTPDGDGGWEVDDEFRDVTFNSNTLDNLHSCNLLKRLVIRPGLSCHNLANSFYTSLPFHWPMLQDFELGGDLFFPTAHPIATIEACIGLLDNAPTLQRLVFPHIIGDVTLPLDRVYSRCEMVGCVFEGGEDNAEEYLDWVLVSFPSLSKLWLVLEANSELTEMHDRIKGECEDHQISLNQCRPTIWCVISKVNRSNAETSC